MIVHGWPGYNKCMDIHCQDFININGSGTTVWTEQGLDLQVCRLKCALQPKDDPTTWSSKYDEKSQFYSKLNIEEKQDKFLQ